MKKLSKIIIVMLLIITVIFAQQLFDDKMSFYIEDANINELDYKYVISKVKKKLKIDNHEKVYVLGTFDSETQNNNTENGFYVHIAEDESIGFSSNIAVENKNGKYKVYTLFKRENKIIIYRFFKNEYVIDGMDVSLNDVFKTISEVRWPALFAELHDESRYDFNIKPTKILYRDIYQLNDEDTYILTNEIFTKINDYKFSMNDEKYLETTVSLYDQQGEARRSEISLFLNVYETE